MLPLLILSLAALASALPTTEMTPRQTKPYQSKSFSGSLFHEPSRIVNFSLGFLARKISGWRHLQNSDIPNHLPTSSSLNQMLTLPPSPRRPRPNLSLLSPDLALLQINASNGPRSIRRILHHRLNHPINQHFNVSQHRDIQHLLLALILQQHGEHDGMGLGG
jgi:hypothetical protein